MFHRAFEKLKILAAKKIILAAKKNILAAKIFILAAIILTHSEKLFFIAM